MNKIELLKTVLVVIFVIFVFAMVIYFIYYRERQNAEICKSNCETLGYQYLWYKGGFVKSCWCLRKGEPFRIL
jgi:hypothetical protein